jgi:putative PIN family toxin of toxin-antitoxin system
MKAERIVLDSNVLISALLNPDGVPRRLLDLLAERSANLIFSAPTFSELAERLAKSKFDRYRSDEQLLAYLDGLAELGEWVEPREEIIACRDPDDDKFLATAISGEADVLVSGDADLLVLDPFRGLPIVAPVRCLDALARD